MVDRGELVEYCDALLEARRFRDYCPNGLQVEGRARIGRLVSGVTASLALVEAAVERGADALLVHHGYFWRNEPAPLTGHKRSRLARLLAQEINLIAYHLPLDAHPELGNNAQLARLLGIAGAEPLGGEGELVWRGELAAPMAAADFAAHIAARLGREPLHVDGGGHPVRRVAWCTGGAQGRIDAALRCGADAYLSGEISESTVHVARECGLHFYACGHHASERYGARALGEHLAARFALHHEFVDIDNPV